MNRKFIVLLGLMCVLLLCAQADAADLFYAKNPSTIAVAGGATLNTGTAMVTGQCYLESIVLSQGRAAGDYVLIYDAASATGTAKYDISVGTARETIVVNCDEDNFGTGVFAVSTEATANYTMHVSISYTQ